MINKKGDMPAILLFIVALLLVVLALLSFVSFNGSFEKESKGRSKIMENTIFYEGHIINEAQIIGKKVLLSGGLIMTNEGLKKRFQEIAEKEDLEIQEFNNFFEKIRKGDFKFYNEKTDFIFKMDNLSIKSSSGANFINRNLNLTIIFDSEGNTKIYK